MELDKLIEKTENFIDGISKKGTDDEYYIFFEQKDYYTDILAALKELQNIQNKKIGNYRDWADAYFLFYEQRIGVKPKFGAADGKALKDIAKYLTSVAKGEPLDAWKYILQNWNKLTPFIANQCTVLLINKNLNEILSQLKYGTTKTEQRNANKAADERAVYDYFK